MYEAEVGHVIGSDMYVEHEAEVEHVGLRADVHGVEPDAEVRHVIGVGHDSEVGHVYGAAWT